MLCVNRESSSIMDSFMIIFSFHFVGQMCNINGLRIVCDSLFECPAFPLAQLSADFNLMENINHLTALKLIDEPNKNNQIQVF